MDQEKITVQRIEHVALTVTDVARAKHFYGQILNLTEIPRPKSFDFPGAWYRNGATDLHIIGRQEADAPSRRHVAFYVADIQTAAKILQQNGYLVLWEEKYKIDNIDRFFTEDSDQNRIENMGPECGTDT
jgi:glyoxylase I family protein